MSDDREGRNRIFGGSESSESVERTKSELGSDIPVEEVPLPSRGKVYPSSSALHNRDTLPVRAMTIREEDILTSRAYIKKGTVITELIKSLVAERDVDVRELISGDRNALMVAIRIMGYGAAYNVDITCSACEKKSTNFEFMLDRLELKRLAIDPVSPGMNLFRFKLPVSKREVEFKFLTGKDEEEITVTNEKMKKIGSENDKLISSRLKYAIVSIDGKTDRSLVVSAIDKMLARDSLDLRRFMEKNEPGISMDQEFVCKHCQHVEEVSIPIGTNFFWPQS